jgi:glycosyltransferase involved in cell wall biosynthesis
MAKELQKKLGDNFWLGVNYINEEDSSIKIVCFNAKKSYLLAWRYINFIKANNIGHVFCREARLLFFIILYNKFLFRRKVKFVYEIHSLLSRNRIDSFVDRTLSFFVNRFIFVTKNLQERYMKKYRIDYSRTIVAPDAVDLNIFDLNLTADEARKKLSLPLDKKILCYTGRFKTMEMDKGINDIIKAVKELDNDDILFLAAGGSDKEIDYYKNIIEKSNMQKQIKLIGSRPQTGLAIYQKAADVLLMPFPYNKHYAYYMSPLKMFEYMAARRPIIASNLPSIKEILNDQNAVFCQPDNPSDLARAIGKVLNDHQHSESISGQAYRDVQNYTWAKRVEKILQFI